MRTVAYILLFIAALTSCGRARESVSRIDAVKGRTEAALSAEVTAAGHAWGAPVFIRIFKESDELEVWLAGDDGRYALFKTYPICTWSGALGPKLKEGDKQAPEGFYYVTREAMNPNSQFHLSFNLGFPNAYDRAQGRTGSFLMVHGNCVSVGCFAMTDDGIEEIYLLADAALAQGQPFFRVHIFPFRMTDERMRAAEADQWAAFWRNLKTGYNWFEEKKKPPDASVSDGIYAFSKS